MNKFALVLSGGGFKGAFQVGALRYLQDNWSALNPQTPQMKFDIVAGVSVGSLNGVLTACNEFEQLENLWLDIANNVEEIYTSDFIDTTNTTDNLKFRLDFKKILRRFIPSIQLKLSLLDGLALALSKTKRRQFLDNWLHKIESDFRDNFRAFRSIADNTPLRKKLETLVSADKITDSLYICGFVSLNDGDYHAYKHTEFESDIDFQNAILASTAMPIVWEPVPEIRLKDSFAVIEQSVDGGIRNVSPLSDVVHEIMKDPDNEYTVVIINCNSGELGYEMFNKANIAEIALRSLNEIAITEIFNNDIAEFTRINDLIHQVKEINPDIDLYNFSYRKGRSSEKLCSFKTIIIQPSNDVLGDPLVANKTLNERRMKHGAEKAMMALKRLAECEGEFGLVVV